MPARRRPPWWLLVAVGVGATLLGTITARLSGADITGVSAGEIILMSILAVIGVTTTVITHRAQPASRQ